MYVLLAVDQSLASDSTDEYLRALQFRPLVGLHHVVTVMPPLPSEESPATGASLGGRTLFDQERRHVESTLAESLAQFHDEAFRSVSGKVRIGAPGYDLTEFADEHNCDLIVTGDRRRGAPNRSFLGSVSRHVLRYAKCSVFLARRR